MSIEDTQLSQPVTSPPAEVWDPDHNAPIALRIDGPDDTRGKAAAYFASEWDLDFTQVRLYKAGFAPDHDYIAEMEADGGKEPYDGWPLRECKPGTPEGGTFWVLRTECYEDLI